MWVLIVVSTIGAVACGDGVAAAAHPGAAAGASPAAGGCAVTAADGLRGETHGLAGCFPHPSQGVAALACWHFWVRLSVSPRLLHVCLQADRDSCSRASHTLAGSSCRRACRLLELLEGMTRICGLWVCCRDPPSRPRRTRSQSPGSAAARV